MPPLQVVHLESSAADAAAIREELERSGLECTVTRALTEEESTAALAQPGIDLIWRSPPSLGLMECRR